MQGELTFHLSSSWMYITYTSFLFDLSKRGRNFFSLFVPFYWWFDKKGGEKFGVLYMNVYVIYMHVYFLISISAYMFCLCKKRRSILHLYIYVLFGVVWFMHSLNIFIIFCYAWVKGELLWSLTLIHTYITAWVLSSSKGGDCWSRDPSL